MDTLRVTRHDGYKSPIMASATYEDNDDGISREKGKRQESFFLFFSFISSYQFFLDTYDGISSLRSSFA